MVVNPDGHYVWAVVNAGFAVYDGYKAYKAGKKSEKKGWALAGSVALSAGSSFVKVGHLKKAGKAIGISRRAAFREAKKKAGIPKSEQFKKHKFVYDKTYENRTVYKFSNNKYIVLHKNDKNGRGPHFHGADNSKGSPMKRSNTKYNQFKWHAPESKKGYRQ